MRWLISLVSLGALAGAPGGQTVPANSAELEAHLATVRAEREARFLEAWAAADEVQREAALGLLRGGRRPGAPAGAPLGLDLLGRATRRLQGVPESDEATRRARRSADALDLMIVPGFVEAPDEGGPAPRVTVRVHPLYSAPPRETARVALYWRSPTGEESRARREPAVPAAFGAPGFDMYLAAPREPGTWELVPELELSSGATARGAPVRFDVWPRGSGPAVEASLRRAALEGLASHGLRSAAVVHPGEVLGPAPEALDAETELWTVALEPSRGEPRGVWLLFLPGPADVLGPLERGPAWREAAAAAHVHLAASALGRSPGDSLRAVRERFPGLPVVVVAWGGAVTRLAFLRLTPASPDSPGLDPEGWAVLESVPGVLETGSVPTLRRGPEGLPELVVRQGLPGELAAWFESRWPSDD